MEHRIKYKTIKLLGGKKEENHWALGPGKEFFESTPKT